MHARRGPRRRFNYSNVMSSLAVFLVVAGGSAQALSGSDTVFSDDIVNGAVRHPDLADDSVGTKNIADGRVLNGDLGANAVTTAKVANESLTSDDLASNSVDGSEIVTGAVDTEEVEDNGLIGGDITDNTLTGADIQESSLGQVTAATLGGLGRSAGGGACDPESTAFVTCKSVTINLPAPSRVLVIGRVRALAEVSASHGRGRCRVGTSVTGAIAGSEAFLSTGDGADTDSVAVIGVSPVIGPGAVGFGTDCNQDQTSGAIRYDGAGVTAIALSSS